MSTESDTLPAAIAARETFLILRLDAEDAASLRIALCRRKGVGYIPDGGGNEEGRLVAEICRGWIDERDAHDTLDGLDNIPFRDCPLSEVVEGDLRPFLEGRR